MVSSFIIDESSGSNNPTRAGWLAVSFLVANEIRGIFVAFEGARIMGWI
jgi:hypothetical protein